MGKLVALSKVADGFAITRIDLETAADIPGIDDATFQRYVLDAKQNCPVTWGSWSALDVATGNIIWQTADPTPGTLDTGAVSVANGVVYAGSYSGQMYALDALNGGILWGFASGGSVIDGPSIVDGLVY